MSDQAPMLLTVPTELERTDGFLDLTVLATSALGVWWLALQGIPITFIAPFTVPLAIWVLTGEAAADVPFVGAVAAGLRNLFGQRRAHEWLLAYAHYARLAVWPVQKERCVQYSRSARRQTTAWLGQQNVAIRWNLWRASSWALATRCSLSGKRAK